MIDTRLDKTKLRKKHSALGDFKMQTVAMGWYQVVPKGLCALAPDEDKVPWDSHLLSAEGHQKVGTPDLGFQFKEELGVWG